MDIKFKHTYFFAENFNKIDEIVYICEQFSIAAVSIDLKMANKLEQNGCTVLFVEKGTGTFKKAVKQLNPNCFLIYSDTLSPHAQWLSNRYSTYTIFGKSLTSADKGYYRALHCNTTNCGPLMNRLHKAFGLWGRIYGNNIGMIDCGWKDLFRYIYYKVFWGYRAVFAGLPGLFSKLVFVPTTEIKDVYVENGFDVSKVVVTGSPLEDVLMRKYNKAKNIRPKTEIDVLFFSQPLYRRGLQTQWIKEVEALVDDCTQNSLSLTILLHPADNYDYYKHLEKKSNIVAGKRTLDDNLRYVLDSKLIVIKCSSTHVIPLACEQPVAYLDYKGIWPFRDMKKKFDENMILNNENSIKKIFQYLSANREKAMLNQMALLKQLGIFDGNSLARIRTHIIGSTGMI